MGKLPRGEGAQYNIYPPETNSAFRKRSFEVGELLYKSIDMPRDDKPPIFLSFFIARPFEKVARVFTAGRK